MKPEIIVAICLIAIVLTAIVISIICSVVFKKRVKANSKIYHALLSLNKNYNFHNIKPVLKFHHTCSSKRQLDNYNFDKALRQIVESDISYFRTLIKYTNENFKLSSQYRADCTELLKENALTKSEIKSFKIPNNTWLRIEEQLFNKNLLSYTTDFKIYIKATYTSPQGRNGYYRDYYYYQIAVDNILTIIDREKQLAAEKEKYEREKREERERQKALRPAHQIERSKLTKKLRYEIFERDHYKCVICGRSAEDGVILHVDHIIPVSKGGLTVPENLRTLCADCNLGKSDTLPITKI